MIPAFIALLMVSPQAVAVHAEASDGSGLTVSSFYWGRIETKVVDPSQRSIIPGGLPRRGRPRYGPDAVILQTRETYALVRNTGTRKIKAVTWDYVFYSDAKHETEIKRFEFRTKESIEPGEMKFLTEHVDDGPPSAYGDVVVTRVEYDDDTVWTRPAS